MDFEPNNLAGQIVRKLHDMITSQRLAYSDLPEAEQRAVIEDLNRIATDIVEQAIDVVVGQKSTILNGTMKNVTYKGDVCSTTVCFDLTEKGVHELSHKSHKSVKIAYVPSGEEMRSLGERIASEPDQTPMFGDNDDGDPISHDLARAPSTLRIEDKTEPETKTETKPVKRKYTKKTDAKKPSKSPTANKKAAAGIRAPRKRRSLSVVSPANDMDLASDG